MAGAMRKMGEYLGLVEQADYDDVYDDEPAPSREPRGAEAAAPVREHGAREQRAARTPAVIRPAAVAHIDDRRRREVSSADAELTRIETVTPRTFNDARVVGENFRSGVPVIMNLTELDDSDAKRMVDFGAGLVFSVHGAITRVTAGVFLLTPANVVVSDEDKQRIAGGGLYDRT
ncbi:cell division protein SepF [Aeromicrobium sp. Sec7.5]|uniref:cell division protein SepF n=1 Tax=Aeromicrobium sp. Sec7.5 TaxID=3121276 RepID=UPI002FE4B5E3